MTLDEKTIDYAIRVIQTVGFPSFVAGWLLFKTDRKIEDVTKALTDLNITANKIMARTDK